MYLDVISFSYLIIYVRVCGVCVCMYIKIEGGYFQNKGKKRQKSLTKQRTLQKGVDWEIIRKLKVFIQNSIELYVLLKQHQ